MESVELDWIDCYGYDNGLAYSYTSGGTAHTFSWDNGTWFGDTVSTLTQVFIQLGCRFWGCTATDTVFIHEPSLLYVDIDVSQTILHIVWELMRLVAALAGGTGSYSYVWDDNPVQPQTSSTATSLLADIFILLMVHILCSYSIKGYSYCHWC